MAVLSPGHQSISPGGGVMQESAADATANGFADNELPNTINETAIAAEVPRPNECAI